MVILYIHGKTDYVHIIRMFGQIYIAYFFIVELNQWEHIGLMIFDSYLYVSVRSKIECSI